MLHVVEHKQRNLTLFSAVLPAVIQHGDKLPLTHEARTAPPSRPLPLYSSRAGAGLNNAVSAARPRRRFRRRSVRRALISVPQDINTCVSVRRGASHQAE